MIIKRKQAGRMTAPDGQGLTSGDAMQKAALNIPPVEELPDWNEENIDSGLAPERRTEDRRNDRRRGYRRIEDKDLISKAHEEAIAIRENAQNQGFEEGLNQARETLDELRANLEKVLSGREEALLSVVHEIAPLAVEVAARIIKTEVSCDETLVLALVKDTIQKAGRNTKSILLKLNPEDTSTVKKTVKETLLSNLNAELVIMDDPAVDQGSCVIETNSGLIDASFSTQLSILRQLFGGKTEK